MAGSGLEVAVRRGILLSVLLGTGCLLASSLPAVAAGNAALAHDVARQLGAAPTTSGVPIWAFNSGLVLTVAQNAGRGAKVRVEPNAGRSGQHWVFGAHGTMRPAENQHLCLNVPKYRSGTPLQLWNCDGKSSERFSTKAPSRHTAVFFVRPGAKTGYCLTALLSSDTVPQPPSLAGIRLCAGLANQAWSLTNLQYVAADVSGGWALQDEHPTMAGSVLTGTGRFTNNLDQYWTSSFIGAAEESPVQLHPVDDTALCVTVRAGQPRGVALTVRPCGSPGQSLMGVGLFFNSIYGSLYFITTPDASSCLQASGKGPAEARPIVLGPCVGNPRDAWSTVDDLETGDGHQCQELYAESSVSDLSMRVGGNGRAGSGVVLSVDDQAAAQVWTDLPAGHQGRPGNADGSITLHPLSDKKLCLAVPGGHYLSGVQLVAETCDGQISQEFVRGAQFGPMGLIAAGAGEFCVAAVAGIKAGSAVGLEPCAQRGDQTWITFFSWYGWGGQQLSATGTVAYPGDSLIISGVSSSGGQAGVSPSPGPASWYTAQDWNSVAAGAGYEIRSFYDPALCLTAPATSAGTQLTAAPCDGSPAQVFYFVGPAAGNGVLWWLQETTAPKMCAAVGSQAGSAGLPLELQTCSATQADESWNRPSFQL
jgi:hypothetical protein